MGELSFPEPAIVLTIAGSDSGGAAGLQADLKTFTRHGVYGMSVLTAVTAQNSQEVRTVFPLPVDLILNQLSAVLEDYGAMAIKTGFIGRVDLIKALAAELASYHPRHLVVDPVLVNHRGEAMFPEEVTGAYRDYLLPLADLVTPNRQEAQLLTGEERVREIITKIKDTGARWVLLKGGLEGREIVDILSDGNYSWTFRSPYVPTINTHGSGDTLSAAICALLARGSNMVDAVMAARSFTYSAIKNAAGWKLGAGHGPVNHIH